MDRGLAPYKMICLFTFGLGGEAYLTFMGNEFDHPEWIEFLRERNAHSFHHCQRLSDLARDDLFKDKVKLFSNNDMLQFDHWYKFMNSGDDGCAAVKHHVDKLICFARGSGLWVLNFHST
jgi:1,4-alpha-glucan branching enzyme